MSLQTITYIARRLKSKQSKRKETKQCKSLNLGIHFSPPFLHPKTTFSTNHLQTFPLKFFIFIFMACYTIFHKLWKMRIHVSYIALFFLFSFTLLPRIHCAEGTFAPSFYTDEIYKELQNVALLLNKDIKSSLGFCIKDPWVLFHRFVSFFFYFNHVSEKHWLIHSVFCWSWYFLLSFRKKDWEEAFDFTGRLDFVDSCVKKKGMGYYIILIF